MMRVLSPTYKIRLTIKDKIQAGNIGTVAQQFADAKPASLHKWFKGPENKTGCDEVMAAVKDALTKAGIEAEVWLDSFTHE